MKTIPVIIVCSLAVLVVACSKDKFQTKPLLKIKSYSSRDLFTGQELQINVNYFDKEGDLNGAFFYARLKRLNVTPLGAGQDKSDSLDAILPDFPPKDQGEILFHQTYAFLKESTIQNDTIVFRFAVRDNGGNTSDTITSDPIVIHL